MRSYELSRQLHNAHGRRDGATCLSTASCCGMLHAHAQWSGALQQLMQRWRHFQHVTACFRKHPASLTATFWRRAGALLQPVSCDTWLPAPASVRGSWRACVPIQTRGDRRDRPACLQKRMIRTRVPETNQRRLLRAQLSERRAHKQASSHGSRRLLRQRAARLEEAARLAPARGGVRGAWNALARAAGVPAGRVLGQPGGEPLSVRFTRRPLAPAAPHRIRQLRRACAAACAEVRARRRCAHASQRHAVRVFHRSSTAGRKHVCSRRRARTPRPALLLRAAVQLGEARVVCGARCVHLVRGCARGKARCICARCSAARLACCAFAAVVEPPVAGAAPLAVRGAQASSVRGARRGRVLQRRRGRPRRARPRRLSPRQPRAAGAREGKALGRVEHRRGRHLRHL
jgi:hypothetical protein